MKSYSLCLILASLTLGASLRVPANGANLQPEVELLDKESRQEQAEGTDAEELSDHGHAEEVSDQGRSTIRDAAVLTSELTKYEDGQYLKGLESLGLKSRTKKVKRLPFIYMQPPHTATVTTVLALSAATGLEVNHDHHILNTRLHSPEGKDWDKKVSFTFVRSPWERVMSCASFHGHIDGGGKNHHHTKELDILRFRNFVKHNLKRGACDYMQTQYNYVFAKASNETEPRQRLTFIGRTSNLQEDFDQVCKLLNVKTIDISKIKQHCYSSCPEAGQSHRDNANTTALRKRDYGEYYDDEAVQIVAQHYKKDIDAFDFKFDSLLKNKVEEVFEDVEEDIEDEKNEDA